MRKKKLRPIPFPQWSPAYRQYITDAIKYGWARSSNEAQAQIAVINRKARNIPMPNELCGAFARSTGKPCQAKANHTGRCRMHGGGVRTRHGV